jgi:Transposase DDE domain
MPDTPVLREEFGQPSEPRPGCDFPVARLLALFHAGTGLFTQLISAPLLTHDLAPVQNVHPALAPGDVLVADRGLCSYAHIAMLVQRGVHAVFRIGSRQIVDFTPHRPFVMPATRRSATIKGRPRSRWIRAFSTDDQRVAWFKPRTCPPWLSAEALEALPPSLVVRELRYDVTRRGFRSRQMTLVTTLLDAEGYPRADLAELYRTRWDAETHLAPLKTTMRMDVLHGQTVLAVHKERLIFAILYHLVRLVMLQSAIQQAVDVERISFLDALRWFGAPDTGVPLELLLVNPVRPHRVEPRVKKRRPKAFPFMSKPRRLLRQALIQHAFGA